MVKSPSAKLILVFLTHFVFRDAEAEFCDLRVGGRIVIIKSEKYLVSKNIIFCFENIASLVRE